MAPESDELPNTSLTGPIVVGAVVALIAIGAGLIAIVTYLGAIGAGVSPFITTMLGLISTTVVSLLALVRIEQTRQDMRNGVFKYQVKEAMDERVVAIRQGKEDRRVEFGKDIRDERKEDRQ